MPTEAQKRAHQKHEASRKRVPIWLETGSPELHALSRIMRKHKLEARVDALRWLIKQVKIP